MSIRTLRVLLLLAGAVAAACSSSVQGGGKAAEGDAAPDHEVQDGTIGTDGADDSAASDTSEGTTALDATPIDSTVEAPADAMELDGGAIEDARAEAPGDGGSVAVAPAAASVSPGGTQSFAASGGGGSYVWSLSGPAGGSLSAATGATVTYTASTVDGNESVTVSGATNSANTTSATVVVSSVTVAPPTASLGCGARQPLTASGGSGTYAWSVAGTAGGWISAPTGASVTYAATGTGDGGTDTVTVQDSLNATSTPGQSAAATVTVTTPCGPVLLWATVPGINNNSALMPGGGIAVNSQYVYWAISYTGQLDPNSPYTAVAIDQVPIGGGVASTLYQALIVSSPLSIDQIDAPGNLALDSDNVYFHVRHRQNPDRYDGVLSQPLDGGSPGTLAYVINELGTPPIGGVATGPGHVYWTTFTDYLSRSWALTSLEVDSGTQTTLGLETFPFQDQSSEYGVAATLQGIYWVPDDLRVVSPAPDAGAADGGVFVAAAQGQLVMAIAADSSNLYWTDQGTMGERVMKVPLGGGTPTTISSWQGGVVGRIALDSTYAYWTQSNGPSTINRVPLAGGAPLAVVTTSSQAQGIAVDATNLYWTDQAGVWQIRKP